MTVAGMSREEFLATASMRHSSSFERLIEHVFAAEVLQQAWFGRAQIVEVLHAEVDAGGYDLVLELGGIVRHVQLKSSQLGGRTKVQTINTALAEKPSGCVVWVRYKPDLLTARVGLSFLWFGAGPGEKLPNLGEEVGWNPATKKPRPLTRRLKQACFDQLDSTSELLDRLFGPAQQTD